MPKAELQTTNESMAHRMASFEVEKAVLPYVYVVSVFDRLSAAATRVEMRDRA